MGDREREEELIEWERLARMHNPEWSYKAKMYSSLLEKACRRIRLLEARQIGHEVAAREIAEALSRMGVDSGCIHEWRPDSRRCTKCGVAE